MMNGSERPMGRKGQKNIYLCSRCGHGFVTIDRDAGVTPFTTGCARAVCEGVAQSMVYGAPQQILANIPAAYEWYKPTEGELVGRTLAVIEHVDRGGLLLREHRPEEKP